MKWVRDTELGELQRVVRALLVHGVLTPTVPDDATWRLARRHTDAADEAFDELCGYRVSRGRRCVVLQRLGGAQRGAALRGRPVFSTPSGQPFDRVRLALLVLSLAVLERAGRQTTLTELAIGVRRAAERMASLPFDPDEHASRLALGHAIGALEQRGAVRLTDGSREAWERGDERAEALYDVDHELCRVLLPLGVGLARSGGLRALLGRDQGLGGRDELRRLRRQALSRRLLEDPVVYLDDLDEAERAHLHSEGGRLAALLERLTGGVIERRKEGLALVDSGSRLSDRAFPKGGGAQQAALLLAGALARRRDDLPTVPAPQLDDRQGALLDAIDAAAPAEVEAAGGASPAPWPRVHRPFASETVLRELALELHAAVGPMMARSSHREDPEAVLQDGLEVLAAFDLVRVATGGVALMPALARFREPKVEAEPELQPQLGLFGGRLRPQHQEGSRGQ